MIQALYDPVLGGHLLDSTQQGAAFQNDLLFMNVVSTLHAQGIAAPAATIVEKNGILDLRLLCSPIEDQGGIGSCSANAVVGALEFLQIRNTSKHTNLSRMFLYYNARLMDQRQNEDKGSHLRLAIGTLSSIGTCSEAKWPYDPKRVFVRPSWGSYREAFPNKVGAYYRIGGSSTTRIDLIKRALQGQHTVCFGVTVDDAFKLYRSGTLTMPTDDRGDTGRHAMLIVGYDNTRHTFIVRNSWGTWWGEKGYCHMPWGYLAASDAEDFWVVTLAPTHV